MYSKERSYCMHVKMKGQGIMPLWMTSSISAAKFQFLDAQTPQNRMFKVPVCLVMVWFVDKLIAVMKKLYLLNELKSIRSSSRGAAYHEFCFHQR